MEALKKLDLNPVDAEKDDTQEFLEHHNFAKEFSKSWTVFVEKHMVNAWLKEMRKRFPDPRAVQGNGFQFRTHLKEKTVYSTFYNVEIPKINIQGNHSCIRKHIQTKHEDNNIPQVPRTHPISFTTNPTRVLSIF